MKLNQAILDVARYEGKSYCGKSGRKSWSQCILWDDVLPGFGVRISPKNRKTFVVSYRADGRKRMKTLGQVGPLSLSRARARAREILEGGEAPAVERRAARDGRVEQVKSLKTFAHLCHAYIEHQRKIRHRSWRAERMRIQRYVLPVLGSMRLAEVGPRDAGKLRSRLVSRFPAERRKLTPLFNSIFDWGQEPAEAGERKAAGGRSSVKRARKKTAQPEERVLEETLEVPSFETDEKEGEPDVTASGAKPAPAVPLPRAPEPSLPAPPAPPESDRLAKLRLRQPFARQSTHGGVVSLSPEELEIETGFALQFGETYCFEVLDGDRGLVLESRVLACRLARTVRNRFGDLEPRYRAKLEIERILSQAKDFWALL